MGCEATHVLGVYFVSPFQHLQRSDLGASRKTAPADPNATVT